MSRINSAQQPLFAIAVPIWQGIRESVGSHLPRAELLRRTVPVLIAIFASLAAIGLVSQTLQSRQSAFALAEERLALMADLTAVRLKDESLKPDSNWQSALAASLPKGATQDERTALLANDDGDIQARAPLMTTETASLLAILGPQQPLTTFGADAGVLRMALTDGTDAFVTVRDLPDKNAQIAFIQPVRCGPCQLAARRKPRNHSPHLHRSRACAAWRRRLVSRPGRDAQRGRCRFRSPHRGFVGLPRLAMEFRARTHPLVGADVPGAWLGCRSTRPWPSAPSRRRSTPTTISAAIVDRHLRDGNNAFRSELPHAPRRRPLARHAAARTHDPRQGHGESLTSPASPSSSSRTHSASPDANARLRDAVETISEAFVLWDHENRS